jgi:hypothetical protein
MDFLDTEIRMRLGRFLQKEDTLEQFREWFTPATWDVHLLGNQPAANLAYQVSFLIAEYVTGKINESQLRRRLEPLIETYVATYGDMEQDLRTQLTSSIRNEKFAAAGT